jgi:predicted NUDIX family NTP pyrophosphohydrolase
MAVLALLVVHSGPKVAARRLGAVSIAQEQYRGDVVQWNAVRLATAIIQLRES